MESHDSHCTYKMAGKRPWTPDGRVTIVRRGGVRLPVELRVEFADGRVANETWNGRDRWYRLSYEGAKVVRAVVDPGRKIAIDVEPRDRS